MNFYDDPSIDIFKLWRNRILLVLNLILVVNVILIIFNTDYTEINPYFMFRFSIYLLIVTFSIAQFFIKSLEYRSRAYIVMTFIALHSYFLLIGYSDNLKNEVWFFSLPIMAALLLDYRAAAIGLLINVSHLIIVINAANTLHSDLLHHSESDWIIYKISQIGFNTFITFTIIVLMSVLEGTVAKLKTASGNLLNEKENIEVTNKKLINEISERKAVESSLLKKEMMLLKAQKLNNFSEFELDLKNRTYKFSDDLIKTIGLKNPSGSFEELKGFLDYVDHDDLPGLKESYYLFKEGRSSFDCTYRINRPIAGGIIWVRSKAEIVDYNGNSPVLIYGTVQDITIEKEREYEHHKREIMYEKLFNTANDSIFIMKGEMFIDCNQKTLDIFDVERDGIIGHFPWEFSPEFQPDGLSSIEKARKYIDEAYSKKPQFFYWKHKTAHGAEFDAEVALNCTIVENEQFLQAIVRDVTERMSHQKELAASEERLKLALEATRDALWELELPSGKIETAIEFIDMFGMDQRDQPTLYLWLEFVHNDDKNLLFDLLTSPREINPENRFSLEYRIKFGDAEWKWLATHGKVVKFSENGSPLQIVGTNSDITKRKFDEERIKYLNRDLEVRVQKRTEQLENALEDLKDENDRRRIAQEELSRAKENLSNALKKEKELNELKSRFISMVSHEYRTPLTVILSSTYLLDAFFNQNKKDDFEKNLRQIQNSVRYMTKLLDEVLFVGKGESAILRLRKDRLNLKKFIPDLIEETKYIALPGQEFTTDFPEESLTYYGDESALRYIIINLLSNASKYSPINSTIHVSASFDKSGELMLISVADKGKGIPDEDKEHVFSPLHRGKNVGSVPGTGLGLSIVHQYVMALKGRIWFESDEDTGTVFYVELPLETKL